MTSPEGNESGTWSLSSDNTKLTIVSSDDEESEVLDVKSLTSNKLELFYAEEFTEDMDEDSENETFAISITLLHSNGTNPVFWIGFFYLCH